MQIDELKRKLRDLRHFEERIRFPGVADNRKKNYIWDRYFSTNIMPGRTVRYPLDYLLECDHSTRKNIFDEFFFEIYAAAFHMTGGPSLNVSLLSELGLSASDGIEEIKKRFRELAKKYHPDLGGDHEKMIELLDAYNKLINGM